ncbi:MAG: recombinase family protein [Herminiimonas sp.]|uniref:recombinase family protein n=1 Tax=Herminiimonas sp. TaxID=1926289 RepID=UPI0027232DC5|nr:recombinase family protein [Herminiimonas sp.]MDO9422166.1 recombinase family protein [Herminiimonas sp.]
MKMGKRYIGYFRVSTQKQGMSGLGLEAQQTAVDQFTCYDEWIKVNEYVEIESGRSAAKSRPQLLAAIAQCKREGCTLVIAKLDRLARDVRFFLETLDDSGVSIRFAEFADIDPKTDEGRMLLIGMANFAEFEGRRIGSRTKAALAAAKARGVILGAAGHANLKPCLDRRIEDANLFAERMRGQIDGFRLRLLTQRQMVAELNDLRIGTATGRTWTLIQLQRLVARLAI